MSDERVSRPTLDRDHPFRRASTLWSAASLRRTAGDDDRDADDLSFVENGVRAAYQVIDTYLRQGRRVASQFGRMSYAPIGANGDLQDLQARTLQIGNELMANWFDLIGLYTDRILNAGAGWPDEDDYDEPEPHVPSSGPTVNIAYEITSTRPVKIYHEFLPGRATTELNAHSLTSTAGGEPIPLRVAPDRSGERIVLSVDVSQPHPPGLYTGTLLHAVHGTPVGTLCLELG